jgi:hypothetical protein
MAAEVTGSMVHPSMEAPLERAVWKLQNKDAGVKW